MFRAETMISVFFILCLQKTLITAEQTVIENFDVAKYMGRWYVIASFPTIFMPTSNVDTRATYTLNPNGTFYVLNESWSDKGEKVSIEGITYKSNPSSNEAKFKVTFYSPRVTGYYWVLYVDDEYQHALVGHPLKQYLWILDRKTQIDDEIYNQLVEKARIEGYDVQKLEKTPQSKNPPPLPESV